MLGTVERDPPPKTLINTEREEREREMGKEERERSGGVVCARNTKSANHSVGEEMEVGNNSKKCKSSYFLGDLKFNLYDLDLL